MALCRGHKEEALHWELKPSHLSPIWKHSELQPFITYTEEIKSEVITLDWFNAGRAHFSLKSLLSRNVHTSCRSVGTERLLPLFHSVCTGLMLWNPDDRLSTHMWTNIVLYFSLSPPDVSPSSPASFFLSFLCLFFFNPPPVSPVYSTPPGSRIQQGEDSSAFTTARSRCSRQGQRVRTAKLIRIKTEFKRWQDFFLETKI